MRGCHPTNLTVGGSALSTTPACARLEGGARYCSCHSHLCNAHLHDYSELRVKRLVPGRNAFQFPFQVFDCEHTIRQPVI